MGHRALWSERPYWRVPEYRIFFFLCLRPPKLWMTLEVDQELKCSTSSKWLDIPPSVPPPPSCGHMCKSYGLQIIDWHRNPLQEFHLGVGQTRGYSRAQGLGLAVRNYAPTSQPAMRNCALPLHLAVRNRTAIFFD